MRFTHRALLAAALALLPGDPPALPALEAEGSLFVQAGPAAPGAELPGGPVPDWNGQIAASTRISGTGPEAELAIEALLVHDMVFRADLLYLEEASVAWKPLDAVTLRLGRQRIGYGCGIAWSVVDDLDPQPMPFDPHSPRVGLDALRFSADLASLDVPLLLSAVAFAPRAQGAGALIVAYESVSSGASGPAAPFARLDECGAGAQVSAFLGGIELGVAGSLHQFTQSAPFSLGGWATADIGGFVFGAEGAWRRGARAEGAGESVELLLNCNRRLGDFAVIAEGRWISGSDRVWLFGELSWSSGDVEAALATLLSVRDASGLVDASLSWSASETLVLSASAAFYVRPEALPEIGPSPYRCTVTLGAEYFF